MAFSSNNDGDSVMGEINVTPLVDVMLVLLVAFIVTAPLLTNAVKVNLPKTAATAPAEQVPTVTVSIDSNSRVFLDKQEIGRDDLERALKSRLADTPELALSLQGDEAAPYGAVAKTMAAIERSGVTRLSVLTAGE